MLGNLKPLNTLLRGLPQKNGEASDVPVDTSIGRARKKVIKSVEARLRDRMTTGERFADMLVRKAGNMGFVLLNAVFFIMWIAVNTGIIPGIPIFDPFPFILLTMLVSLEAIFLSVLVLISQNRE